MLKKDDLSKLYQLYSNMNDEQQLDFYKHFGLVYISQLDPMNKLEEEHEDFSAYKFDYTRIFNNKNSKDFLDKYIYKIQKKLERDSLIVAIKLDELEKYRYCPTTNIYKILDSTDFDRFLILAQQHETKQAIKHFEQKLKNGYSASDLYNVDRTIAISLLPQLVKKYGDITKNYPCDMNDINEWKSVVIKIVWFLNEVIYSEDKDKISLMNEIELNKYNNYYNEAKQLFAEYFNCLWLT